MSKEKLVPRLRFESFLKKLDWQYTKLGEVADIVGGGTPSTQIKKYWNGDINWFSPTEIGETSYLNSSERKITKLGLKKSSAKILPIGTVLFTSRAGIGKTAILEKESTTNQGFQSIVPKKNILNSYFIYSRSEEIKNYAEIVGAGSTFVEVSGKQLEKMMLLIPELKEQQKIGSFFEKMDKMIQLQQSKVNKVKDIKSAYLSEMFPKEGEKYPKRRFEGSTEPWYKNKFNEITEYITSSLSANNSLIKGRYELYDANELIGYTNSSGQKQEYVTIIKDGSGVGRVRLLPKDSNFIGTMGAIVNKEQTDIHYIYAYLQQFNFTEFITGATVPHVYYRDYGESTAYHPSYEEQVKIGKLFKNLDNQISIEEEKLAKLEKLKQSYLNDMFV